MLKINKSIIIDASPSETWEVFSELEKWPKYCDYITKAYWTSKERWNSHSTFVQVMKGIGPFNYTSHPKIIKIKKQNFVAWTGTGSLVQGVHTLTFQKINNKTKVINKEYFKGILAPIIFPFIKKKFEEYFEQFLNGLKRETELRF